MAIYAIADLHLSLNTDKPMDVFGPNWENHYKKIEKNWRETVTEDDTVLIPGDFSWETYLENTYKDFKFLNNLPGRKILLKGNHDYWWTTLTSIRNYLKTNGFDTIDILYNNSYEVEKFVIAGARGWDYTKENDRKIIEREINRLELSLKDAISKSNNPIIVCMHYPPISSKNTNNEFERKILYILKEYNVKMCLYGHLHGTSHCKAINGKVEGIQFELVSSDFLNFKLIKIA